MIDRKKLARVFYDHRTSCGISENAAANRAEILITDVQNIERAAQVSADVIARACKWLGEDPREFRTTAEAS